MIDTEGSDLNGGGLVENEIVDTIGDAVSGIPAPIKKNALKAFAQLCTAAIDIPVAHLEGIAAEKRAETQARVKIISTGANQIASQMDVDLEYARIAVKKYGQRIVREQVNLDAIAENAAKELALEKRDTPTEDKEISEDWINTFEKEASSKSSDEMRLLFGKILAGEIRKPSSYSIKTVKIISQLDNQAAKAFQQLCSLCITLRAEDHIIDSRVISLSGNAGENSLQEYGLSFNQLNLLHEYGLIISDYNSYLDYQASIVTSENIVALPFEYLKEWYALRPEGVRPPNTNFRLNGVALSQSGKELLDVIDVTPSEKYTAALREYFINVKKMEVVDVSSPDPSATS